MKTGNHFNGNEINSSIDRLYELLVDRATCGLTVDEMSECQALQSKHGQHPDADWSIDLAAAGIDLAWFDPSQYEAMPNSLADKIRIRPTFRVVEESPARQAVIPHRREQPIFGTISSETPSMSNRSRIRAWAPWLAAAACLVLAIAAELQFILPNSQSAVIEQYRVLVEDEPDTIVLPWSAGDEISHVAGDVVWNNRLQKGYMRIRGLDIHPTGDEVYQLWIVDGGRPDQPPVDGGVFDVEVAGDDVLIPIHAKLPIRKPAVFAVTEETDPLGVVVSEKGKRGEFVIVASIS